MSEGSLFNVGKCSANVQGNDYGDYYCTGTNEFGTRSAKFTLFGKFYIILKNENKIYL
jgi:hypothetical protein